LRSCINTLFIFFLFFASVKINAQSLPYSTIKSDNKNIPSYAIGIVRNDSLIYAKGYGMANLEYDIPITPETIFHMASVFKQFTAFSIVLLAKQGKLNLDDDVLSRPEIG
jgi:CubicO group peptidase (beta-lactamase class C family)